MIRCIEFAILASLINFTSNFEHPLRTYSYSKRYNNLQNNDPNKFCKGYICEHSGLTETTVTSMLNIENTLRNSYALSHNISNLYMLEWYPVLQYWAQDKANLCLPPTVDEFYDFAVIQKYGIPKHDGEYKDACQVVIVSQSIEAKDTTPQQMQERITDYIYQNRLRHFKRLNFNQWGLNRKQVSQVGCGYTLRLNETHYVDHLVCLYCVFRFKRKESYYTTTRGAPCTNCNYYKTEYPWRCGKRYQHLCVASVTNENHRPQIINWSCLKQGNQFKVKSKKTRFVNFEKLISPIEIQESYHQERQQQNQPQYHHHQQQQQPQPQQPPSPSSSPPPPATMQTRKPINEVIKFLNNNKDKEDNWSLMEEIVKAKQFSYRKYRQNSDNCNICKVLLAFAASLMCVSLISVFYVVYILNRDENKQKQ